MNTRDKIIKEALNQFSVKGYDPVSVRDIAYAVGIKESSLYNHFKNKWDIFESIIKEYSGRGDAFFHSMRLIGDDMQFTVDDRTINMYKNMSPVEFEAISSRIFDYYFTDEINVKLRKMLTIEQFRNPEIAKVYRELSFESSINFQSKLFEAFIQAGLFIEADPYILAMAFFAPIFLIFYMFDNDTQSLKEAKALFEKHVRHFNSTYTKTK